MNGYQSPRLTWSHRPATVRKVRPRVSFTTLLERARAASTTQVARTATRSAKPSRA